MGRNDLCACGSGKKNKKCCGLKTQLEQQKRAPSVRSFFSPKGRPNVNLSKRTLSVIQSTKAMHTHIPAGSCECCEKTVESK